MDPASMKEEQPAEPKRCSNSCGFFANPNCGDMCSKCSREVQASQAQAAKAMAAAVPHSQAIAQQLHQQQQLQLQQQDAVHLPPIVAIAEPAVVSQPSSVEIAQQQPSCPNSATSEPSKAAPVSATSSEAQPMVPEATANPVAASAVAAQATVSADEEGDPEPPRRIQKHSNRCFSCSKKVGLTGFRCRCGYVFCGPHRLAEAHACDFDYKASGREHLAKANPLIQADRVQRF